MSSGAPQPQRTVGDVVKASRSAMVSLAQSHIKHRPPDVLLSTAIWQWITHYARSLFLPRHAFKEYASGHNGIFPIANECKVAVASDWGTGTENAYRVRDEILKASPAYTIHLGDVYYSGTLEEFDDYFLPEDAWPRGSERTLVLNANHEMYSGGDAYFDCAIKEYGQETSYFCLENDHWRIIGLDTGYYARSVPLLELLLTRTIRLHSAITTWLHRTVFADPSDVRPVVLLGHHQWFSSFDTEYPHLGTDLALYLGKAAVWLWGHEHRFAGYGPDGVNGQRVRARCIGHGGMPIELGKKKARKRNLVFVDEREADTVNGKPVGFCGYAVMDLKGPRLTITYKDERGVQLLEESWDGGTHSVAPTSHLTLQPGKTWSDL